MTDTEKIIQNYEKARRNYRKAERRCNIAFWIWMLNVIVQVLANLDKIFPFLNSQ